MKKFSLISAALMVLVTLSAFSFAESPFYNRRPASQLRKHKKPRAIILQRKRQNPRAIILQRNGQNPRAIILQRKRQNPRAIILQRNRQRALGPNMKSPRQ